MRPYSVFCFLREHPELQSMKESRQHKNTDTYVHCSHVALKSIRMIRSMKIQADVEAVVRGAMLHDFHLDDVRREPCSSWQRAKRHPQVALAKAEEIFELGWREKNIIASHMWPIQIGQIPRCKEAVIVNLADKLCAIEERFLWNHAGKKMNRDILFLKKMERENSAISKI